MQLEFRREFMDDEHPAPAEGTTGAGLLACRRLWLGLIITSEGLRFYRDAQQLTTSGKLLSTETVRQEAVVANPHEA